MFFMSEILGQVRRMIAR
jgi:DNA-binding PadR family transcriptional regulator